MEHHSKQYRAILDELRDLRLERDRLVREANVVRLRHRALIIKHHLNLCIGPYPGLSAQQHRTLLDYFRHTISRFRRHFDAVFEQEDPFFSIHPRARGVRQILSHGQFGVFLMGRHPRLGQDSPVRMLNNDVLSVIHRHLVCPP